MSKNHYNHLLYVNCMTYNHASYIEDTMNGFTMQQTSFPFVCIIVDDASTDGEPDVIGHYLSDHFNLEDNTVARQKETDDYILTYAQHKTNRNCYFTTVLLKYNHYKKKAKSPYFKEWIENVKYVAMCEGDDYWTDPLKLQKQVDFMESSPEYSICCHNVYLLINNEIKRKVVPESIIDKDFTFTNKDNLEFWMTETSSLVYRKEIYDRIPLSQYKFTRDTHIVYHLLRNGKGFCFAFYGSVYRHHPSGVYSMTNSFDKSFNAYLIYKELSTFNKDDDVLTSFFNKYKLAFLDVLRQQVYDGTISRKIIKAIRIYSDDIRTENGIYAKMLVLWKVFKSYIKGKIRKSQTINLYTQN